MHLQLIHWILVTQIKSKFLLTTGMLSIYTWWRANVDIRPVINKEAVIAYVAKYASKAESTSSSFKDILHNVTTQLKDDDRAGIAYQKMMSTFVGERDISAQETCHILFQCPVTRSSQVTWSLCVKPGNTTAFLDFENSNRERKSIFEYYVERDPDVEGIEQVSLFEFATHWDWRGRNLHKHIEHVHNDPLPIITHQPEDPDSDSESIHVDNNDDGPMRFQWMQEAAGGPNSTTAVSTADNLGRRDMDLHYNWHGNSPRSTQIIQDAAHWLAACVKESPNDDAQLLPPAPYVSLKGPQHIVFLQVMAYFKKLAQNPDLKPPTLCVNVDVVHLAPTGVAAFRICGETLNYGLTISLGKVDCRLRQAMPEFSDEILGDIPTILFGDFGQLPPVGEFPLYSTSHLQPNQTSPLSKVETGNDPTQELFRNILLRLQDYESTTDNYQQLCTRFWDQRSADEKAEFDQALHLLPTKELVQKFNHIQLSQCGNPVVCCKTKHNLPGARKASEEDAEGLQKEIVLAEGPETDQWEGLDPSWMCSKKEQ
ncbi:hypothetical protein EV368DRAFT_66085 [Lentinula lateritia]|nr:hypothetical protein EV368DRAFT_66085 [Lentinula lateritia]